MLGRRSFLLLPTVALAAEGQLRDTSRLTFRGIGPIQIGMTEVQVRNVLKQKLERVDVSEGSWLTEAGAGIVTSEAEIRRLYPQLRVEPHPYLDEGQVYYLRVTPAAPKLKDYELLFETAQGSVTSFRAGLSRAVSSIEGCA